MGIGGERKDTEFYRNNEGREVLRFGTNHAQGALPLVSRKSISGSPVTEGTGENVNIFTAERPMEIIAAKIIAANANAANVKFQQGNDSDGFEDVTEQKAKGTTGNAVVAFTNLDLDHTLVDEGDTVRVNIDYGGTAGTDGTADIVTMLEVLPLD
jgi:hypothetical protein